MDKTASVVIFGTGRLSSLSWYMLTHDSPYRVEAFTVDRAYLGRCTHEGLPVVAFDEVAQLYPPSQIDMHIPLGYQRVNELRRERFQQARAMGYHFASYVSSRASVHPDARLGANCLVYEHAMIDAGAILGDDVIVRCGAHVGEHCIIGSHSFIASNAMIGAGSTLGEQATIGVAAVVRDGVRMGARCFTGAGAGMLRDIEDDAVYVGNPARRMPGTGLLVTS